MILRPELVHPLLAHFPIALLSLTPFIRLAWLLTKKPDLKKYLDWSGQLIFYVGLIFYFVVLFTGDESLDIVKKTFCNITSIYHHEDLAHKTLILLVIALVQDILIRLPHEKLKKYQGKLLPITLTVTLFIMLGFLAVTSHHGARLVYEGGAAVTPANKACP